MPSYSTYEVRPSGHGSSSSSRHGSSRRNRDYENYGSAGIDLSSYGGGYDMGYGGGGYSSSSRSGSRRHQDFAYAAPSSRYQEPHHSSSRSSRRDRGRIYDDPFHFEPVISDARLDGYLAGHERRRRRGDYSDYGRDGVDLGTYGGDHHPGHRSSGRRSKPRRHFFRFWKNW